MQSYSVRNNISDDSAGRLPRQPCHRLPWRRFFSAEVAGRIRIGTGLADHTAAGTEWQKFRIKGAELFQEQMKMFLVTVLRFHHSIPVKFIFQFCHSLDENPFFIMTDHFTEFVKRTTSRMPAQEISFWQQAPECIQILCGSGHNALLLLRQRFRWLLSGQEVRVGSYRSGMQKQDSYNFQKHRLCPARENFSR